MRRMEEAMYRKEETLTPPNEESARKDSVDKGIRTSEQAGGAMRLSKEEIAKLRPQKPLPATPLLEKQETEEQVEVEDNSLEQNETSIPKSSISESEKDEEDLSERSANSDSVIILAAGAAASAAAGSAAGAGKMQTGKCDPKPHSFILSTTSSDLCYIYSQEAEATRS